MIKKQNDILSYVYSEGQYFYENQERLKTQSTVSETVVKEVKTEVLNSINPGSGVTVTETSDKIVISSSLAPGGGVTFTEDTAGVIRINSSGDASVKEDHDAETHITKIEITKGMTLDEVIEKLLQGIENNGDTVDGEEINL